MHKSSSSLNRRNFIKSGSALLTGSVLSSGTSLAQSDNQTEIKIKLYRKLGRTGFEASDISMGSTRNRQAEVYRYAYDKGINYFDTAETYANGNSQIMLGEALKFMDRKKVFITTKLHLDSDESTESIMDRFDKCQQKLQTNYIDALYMHGVNDVDILNHNAFHNVTKQLRADGRLRYIGVSSHGPRRGRGDSMEKVLCAAAEDGRFDLMLLIYNFMQEEAGKNIVAACKKNDVGTTAMKTRPGVIAVEPFDPNNPTKTQREYLNRMSERGYSREEAEQRLQRWLKNQSEMQAHTQPFTQKYGLNNEEQLHTTSVLWVLGNKNMHTACISFNEFGMVDKYVAISGQTMSSGDRKFLERYGSIYNSEYCRHGCTTCTDSCANQIPVSTIMRYSYYFNNQGREKEAMIKYSRLGDLNGLACAGCSAPCLNACPHQVHVPAQLMQAHSILSLV
jgi:predicted aldo/keto reductase-like oxidoreductase